MDKSVIITKTTFSAIKKNRKNGDMCPPCLQVAYLVHTEELSEWWVRRFPLGLSTGGHSTLLVESQAMVADNTIRLSEIEKKDNQNPFKKNQRTDIYKSKKVTL